MILLGSVSVCHQNGSVGEDAAGFAGKRDTRCLTLAVSEEHWDGLGLWSLELYL